MSATKGKVLIVDDSAMNRALLSDMLGDEYEVIEAENGLQAVEMLSRLHSELTIMFLDIVMPEMDGFEVLAAMNKSGWINEVPVIIISSEDSYTHIDHAYKLGAAEYIKRPFDERMVKHRVQNTIMLYTKQRALEEMVVDQMLEKEKSNLMMVDILSHIVEFRNGESGMHVLHIRVLTEVLLGQLAKMTDEYDLTPERIMLIANAAALHDIGKIVVPEHILNKPGRFTPEERKIMEEHSAAGANMLEQLPYYRDEELVNVARDICRWHHERYDGGGYPDGLKGDEIPISAQVVALADVYDALTSERVYKPAYSHEQAMNMILNGECGAFSPMLLQCLRDAGDYLEKELRVRSASVRARQELTVVPKGMLKTEGVSGRKLVSLEQERTKRQFMMDNCEGMVFDYEYGFEVVTLSRNFAKRFGLPEVITNPRENTGLLSVLPLDQLLMMHDKVFATKPDEPNVECELTVNVDGRPTTFRCTVLALWSGSIDPEITGAIGEFFPVE